jgi:hypothetical protein
MRLSYAVLITVQLAFCSCLRSDALPSSLEAKQFVESSLRRIGSPVKNFKKQSGYYVQYSNVTFYCLYWDSDLTWRERTNEIEKIYGYVKFAKTTSGWQADHLNYRQTSYPADPDLKCE